MACSTRVCALLKQIMRNTDLMALFVFTPGQLNLMEMIFERFEFGNPKLECFFKKSLMLTQPANGDNEIIEK